MWQFIKTQEAFRRAPLLTLFRSASWYSRCLFHMATVLELPRWHVQMFFPTQRKGFGKFMYAFREYYEPELAYLEKVLSPGKVFIDVGANCGVYALVASRLVGAAGRVIAFEPTAQSFSILQQNIELNHCANVSAFRVAITNNRGKAWLYHGWDPVGNSLGMDPLCGDEGEEVQTNTLDNLVEENRMACVDAIKVDVEGAEELVLRGATRTLIKHKPVVIFEFNPGCAVHLGLSPNGARDLLETLGYEFMVLGDCANSNDPNLRPTYFNIVAVPKRRAAESSGLVHSLRGEPEPTTSQEL
jgi:FkbM family methyltransferase